MTMTLDSQRQQFGHGSPNHMSINFPFTDPWTSQPSAQSSAPAQPPAVSGHDMLLNGHGLPVSGLPISLISKHHHQPSPPHVPPPRTDTASSLSSLASYHSPLSMAASSAAATGPPHMSSTFDPHRHSSLLPMHDPMSTSAFSGYGTSAPPAYQHSGSYGGSLVYQQQESLRQPLNDERRKFAEALDVGQGMLDLSQETPKAYVADRSQRGSADSYGFPSTVSSASSQYDSTDYSDMDSVTSSKPSSRLSSVQSMLPGLASGMGASPYSMTPQSMMSSFSSKVSVSTQKKHKCKVCDKRFTRPSSLQTHMYSHTGEKPFACEVEGCGRHFSVVSNLRRHKKVHRIFAEAAPSEAGSEDQDLDLDHDHISDE